MKRLAKLFGFDNDESAATNSNIQPIVEQDQVILDGSNPKINSNSLLKEVSLADIHQAKVSVITPNPYQPRKTFNEDSLRELALSITEHGVLQPLIVRKTAEDTFELIAGERRLRASKLAGLTQVPVIVKDFADIEMAEVAMIENLQREDLHFLEEALGYQQMIASFGFTQEELAKRVGKNQSTVANKLRLLKLTPDVQKTLREAELSERHARALLKIENVQEQTNVLNTIIERQLNVRESEEFIAMYTQGISQKVDKKKKQNIVKIIKDVRIFLNTINQVVGEMKKAGLKIKMQQVQDEDFITIHLKIPKQRK